MFTASQPPKGNENETDLTPLVSQLICGQFTPEPPFIQSRAHSEHSRILLHSSFWCSTLGLRYAPVIACRELDHIKSLRDFVALAEVQRHILGLFSLRNEGPSFSWKDFAGLGVMRLDTKMFQILKFQRLEKKEKKRISWKLSCHSSNLSADNWRAVPPPCEICQWTASI